MRDLLWHLVMTELKIIKTSCCVILKLEDERETNGDFAENLISIHICKESSTNEILENAHTKRVENWKFNLTEIMMC